VGESEESSSVKLSEREEKLLMRGLDKASSPAGAEKAAQALINSLRERGMNGHEITELFGGSSPSAASISGSIFIPFPAFLSGRFQRLLGPGREN
jgi:hypothetical protein